MPSFNWLDLRRYITELRKEGKLDYGIAIETELALGWCNDAENQLDRYGVAQHYHDITRSIGDRIHDLVSNHLERELQLQTQAHKIQWLETQIELLQARLEAYEPTKIQTEITKTPSS